VAPGFVHAAAFADGGGAIFEIVHAEVGDDQVEGGVGEKHRRRGSFVQRHVIRAAAGDFLGGAFESAAPRIDAVNVRAAAETFGELDQRKAGAAADVEDVRDVRQRHFFEQQQPEHGRPERDFVVRGDDLRRIKVGIEVEEGEFIHRWDGSR